MSKNFVENSKFNSFNYINTLFRHYSGFKKYKNKKLKFFFYSKNITKHKSDTHISLKKIKNLRFDILGKTMQFRGKVSFGFEEQRTVTRPTVYIEDRGQHISTATGRPASLLSRTRQTWVKNIFYFYFLFCRIYHGPLAESKNVTLKFLINVTFKNISMSAKKINSNKKLKLFLSF